MLSDTNTDRLNQYGLDVFVIRGESAADQAGSSRNRNENGLACRRDGDDGVSATCDGRMVQAARTIVGHGVATGK